MAAIAAQESGFTASGCQLALASAQARDFSVIDALMLKRCLRLRSNSSPSHRGAASIPPSPGSSGTSLTQVFAGVSGLLVDRYTSGQQPYRRPCLSDAGQVG